MTIPARRVIHDQPRAAEGAGTAGLASTLRLAWRLYSRRVARYQAELLLSLIYFLFLGPVSIAMRAAGKRFIDDDVRTWSARDPGPRTLEAHERQF